MINNDETARVRAPAPLAVGQSIPTLTVLSGADIGRIQRVDQARLVIGRIAACDMRLRDGGVSRRHAVITREGKSGLAIEDLSSTNGTLVNGAPSRACSLTDGDRIQLGATTLLEFAFLDESENRLRAQLYAGAMRDVLTHSYNRRFFEEELLRSFSHALRHHVPLSVLIIDIDHFKAVNDTFGHQAGDSVIREIASRCRTTIRNEDVLARIGGEEFGIIARSTTAENAGVLAERLRKCIASVAVAHDQHRIAVTASLGVAELDPALHAGPAALMADADRALYEAKDLGRDRVQVGPRAGTSQSAARRSSHHARGE
ncbi:MAG TPA: GGDEF domain-containing protein [Polyangiaceae bacterium]|nr:GGDEF domain-containing protein [Polyangiaceae bacterium]